MNYGWIPSVEIESANGIREVSLYTRQLMNRNIFIQGEMNPTMINDVLNQIMYLAGNDASPINMFINSNGGEVNSGLILYDVLQEIDIPVNMYCTGMAASMAAIILAGGQKNRRFILPHSKVMIHEPLILGGVGGSASSIKTISNSILETKEILNGILAKHTGKTIDEINEATSYDNYMNAEESIRYLF